MSFSSFVKNELCRMEVSDNCCLVAELAAVIDIGGAAIFDGNGASIKIVTENAAFARRIFSMVKELFDICPEVVIRKSKKLKKHTSYTLVVAEYMGAKSLLQKLGILEAGGIEDQLNGKDGYLGKLLNSTCCRKAYLRGGFLAGGSISDPEKTYHLEITCRTLKLAKELNDIISLFNLNSKIIRRKGNHVVYIKEGENIVDFLNIIGAHGALMELENIRILKEMRNNVNRIVNCETANLDKTVHASIRQIENIKYIQNNIGFDNIPESLREMAELRLKYPDASLKELGEMMNPPLGKSGVNHRLRKLDNIAQMGTGLKGEGKKN